MFDGSTELIDKTNSLIGAGQTRLKGKIEKEGAG